MICHRCRVPRCPSHSPPMTEGLLANFFLLLLAARVVVGAHHHHLRTATPSLYKKVCGKLQKAPENGQLYCSRGELRKLRNMSLHVTVATTHLSHGPQRLLRWAISCETPSSREVGLLVCAVGSCKQGRTSHTTAASLTTPADGVGQSGFPLLVKVYVVYGCLFLGGRPGRHDIQA